MSPLIGSVCVGKAWALLTFFMQVTYFQVSSPTRFIYNINWPTWFVAFTKLLHSVDLRIGDIFTMDCINSDYGFYEILTFATLGPIFLMAEGV